MDDNPPLDFLPINVHPSRALYREFTVGSVSAKQTGCMLSVGDGGTRGAKVSGTPQNVENVSKLSAVKHN